MSSELNFVLLPFGELSTEQLYEIMALRQEVFIVEQTCPYQDADFKDQKCLHLMGYHADELVAYTRLVPPAVSYEGYSSIGRVVSKSKIRGTGIGKVLMKESIEQCHKHYPNYRIKISAQEYLRKFYESFGFKSNGDFYDEDDIPHMAMIL